MEDTTKNNLIKAGKISAQVLEFGKTLIKPGTPLLEVIEKVENKILELGAKPAFPPQISCDHIAAHFCPLEDDQIIFENQLASLDVGVHIDGAIGDNAVTVDLSGQNTELVNASRKALESAIEIIQIGTQIKEIGKVIQEVISSYGFSPIRNLSGHSLGIYEVHKKPSMPNYDNGDTTIIENGMIFAIEPFATTGAGIVQDSGNATVFQFQKKVPIRNPITRKVLAEIETFENLPFTTRWLTKKLGPQALMGLRDLTRLSSIKEHPPLVEVQKGLVSQSEHSILIDNDEVIVLTKL